MSATLESAFADAVAEESESDGESIPEGASVSEAFDVALRTGEESNRLAKAVDLLGDLLVAAPELRRRAEAAVAQGGFTLRRESFRKARDWQIDFGPVSGPAGESTVLSISPQCLFRGEKVIATDTGSTPGRGTRIVSVMIGQRIQKLASERGSTLTAFFAATTLANGLKWDTCPGSATISVSIAFVESCTFDMTVFGKAVL